MTEALLAADIAARFTALTALDRTLLIEAGAGSGKTSVLAGRVTSLLAAGRPPREIAAITFTEVAAGELRQRVVEFVAELSDGQVRPDLRAAFPDGPDDRQRAAMAGARDRLDELVCTTIHGFCQHLLRPYPVEAGMDPGASVMDRADAEAMLAGVLEDWLRERLSGPRRPDDLLVTLYADDPGRTGALVRELLRWMVHHRGAPVPSVGMQADMLDGLRTASDKLRSFVAGAACREKETAQIADELDALLHAAPGTGVPQSEVLLHVLRLSAPACCSKVDGGWKAYQKKGKWQTAATAAGLKAMAGRLNEEANACYAACKSAHEDAQSYAAGRVLHLLAAELRDVLARFDVAKRQAALVDFDDLLLKARDLLAGDATVRAALAARHTAVLVDEFQDTDRLQGEILWRLCAAAPDPAVSWTEWTPRPGSLFLVGDPKQAIYRFRGADVASYVAARDRLTAADVGARVVIGQNFRSYRPILEWVNERFQEPLAATGQPGFEPLFTAAAAPGGHVAVATLPVPVDGDGADARRDAEAETVAAFCARVVGALTVRGKGGPRPCRPDDIALLAPTGTDLWRYERALEAAGIAVSTQAGKGFFRRQEVQDLIALTRTLADARDTLALGALLRGPLVGLTEEELLDATDALPSRGDGRAGQLSLWTPVEHVGHTLLCESLAILQGLARAASGTTPFVLLCQAVEEMQVRPLLRRRREGTAERALANVDQFLEAARPYDLRGLQSFAQAMNEQWKDAQRSMEGRPDTEQQSVSLVTMHASKGLEWPVVVPVNMGGELKAQVQAALDPEGRLHLPVFGLQGPGAAEALQAERDELERERHRIWYVAATRARDLLLLPDFSTGIPRNSWMDRFGLRHAGLDPFDPSGLPPGQLGGREEQPNTQDRPTFAAEAALIVSRAHRILHVTPHLAEVGDKGEADSRPLPPMSDDPAEAAAPARGSLARGLVLHKLLEEVLTGELTEKEEELQARATELAVQLGNVPGAERLDADEAARTALRGLAVPEIRAIRGKLVPECTVAASETTDGVEHVTFGVADAVVQEPDGTLSLVVDWKSDVDPAPEAVTGYKAQVAAYLAATGARRGLIVFLSPGSLVDVGQALE